MAKSKDDKITEMVDAVFDWDLDAIIEFVQNTKRDEYEAMSDADLDVEYEDSGLGDDLGGLLLTQPLKGFTITSPAKQEEECSVCKRKKDVGSKCWCCGN